MQLRPLKNRDVKDVKAFKKTPPPEDHEPSEDPIIYPFCTYASRAERSQLQPLSVAREEQ